LDKAYFSIPKLSLKKIISILLLAAMVFYSMGSYVVYLQNMRAIKKEMKNAIASGRFKARGLANITIDLSSESSVSSIEFEDEKEIRYKGEMYDIVKVTTCNNKLVFECIHDKDETKLVSNFTRLLYSDDAGKTTKSLHFIKYSFPDYTIAGGYTAMPGLYVRKSNKPTLFLFNIPVRYLNVSSPPPWLS
jgi:hypothetical protein